MYDTRFIKAVVFLSSVVASLVVPGSVFAFSTFSVGGNASTASIQATVDAFRAALGNPNNGNAAGPLASGRREINWDGGGPPVDANAPGEHRSTSSSIPEADNSQLQVPGSFRGRRAGEQTADLTVSSIIQHWETSSGCSVQTGYSPRLKVT